METHSTSADEVLRLLRRLPPRDRLRVVMEALPDLEQVLRDTLPPAGFWEGADLATLADSLGVHPVDDFDALLGGWPDNESVDDFIAALRERRRLNPAEAGT